MTTTEENKATVRGYFEDALNRGNLDAWGRYMGDLVMLNGKPFTRDDFAAMRASFVRALPDFHVTIDQQVAEGDVVATRVTIRGTHRGEFHGIPPTGKAVAYGGTAFDRLERGRVVEMWHRTDESTLLRQLGFVLRPA